MALSMMTLTSKKSPTYSWKFKALEKRPPLNSLPMCLSWEIVTASRSPLCEVALCNRDSGRKSRQRFISCGRPDVRSILYMATLTATRCNPVIREMYQCLLKAGKKKKVAMVACMRKLLIILNPIVRDRSHWNLAFSA